MPYPYGKIMQDPKTLLITEDAMEANKIAKWMHSWDYPVKTMEIGKTFFNEDLLDYDLILVDLLLNDDFNRREILKKIGQCHGCPVLWFSQQGISENKYTSHEFNHLEKPFNANQLKFAVEMATYKHQIKKSLVETEERYKLLVENSDDPIIVLGEDGTFKMVNNVAADYFGNSPDYFDGKTLWDVFPKQHADTQIKSVKEAILTGKTLVKVEKTQINGDEKWFSNQLQPIKEYDGKFRSVQLVARDITNQKNIENELLERESFLTGTLNDMHTYVAVLNPSGEVIFVNNTPLKICGLKAADVNGKLFHETAWWNYSPDIKKMIKRDIDLCASGKTLKHEIQIKTKNGLTWIDYSMHPVYDSEGNVKYLVPEGRDITKTKMVKKAMAEEKNRLKNITENLPLGMVFIDVDGDYKYINPKFVEMFGYEQAEIPDGRSWFKQAFPDPKKRRDAILAWKNDFKNAQAGEKRPRTFEVVCKNGDIKIIEFVPVKLKNNEYLMTVNDVTQKKIAENALKQSEERFRTVASSAVDAIIITDQEGNVVFCNSSVQRIFGCNEEDLVGKSVNKIMPGRYHDEFIRRQEQFKLTGRHLLSGKLFESYGFRKDGSEFPIEISITAWDTDEERYTTSIIRDITERKLVEYELKSSEKKFRQMTENIEEVFWIIDPKMSQIIYISPGYKKIWGCSRESLFDNPRSWIESIHPEDRKNVIDTIFRTPNEVQSGKNGINYRIIRPDGSIRWIYGKAFPLTDDENKIQRIAGIAVDITKRVAAEEKYRNLFENINVGVYRCTVGANSRLVESNNSLLKMFQYTKSEIMAIKASYLYLNGEDKVKFDEKVLKCGHIKNEHVQFKKQNGTPFTGLVSAYVVKDEFGNPKYIESIVEDITPLTEIESIMINHPTVSKSISVLNKSFYDQSSLD
jgi:two-component system, sporulation sensor kinase E